MILALANWLLQTSFFEHTQKEENRRQQLVYTWDISHWSIGQAYEMAFVIKLIQKEGSLNIEHVAFKHNFQSKMTSH